MNGLIEIVVLLSPVLMVAAAIEFPRVARVVARYRR